MINERPNDDAIKRARINALREAAEEIVMRSRLWASQGENLSPIERAGQRLADAVLDLADKRLV